MKRGWLIGELGHRVGVPPQTIRYYERLGLLEPPERTESDYRIYSETSEERLRFIQKAKRFGLSLDEIKQLIDIRASGIIPCAELKVMVKQHLHDLACRIPRLCFNPCFGCNVSSHNSCLLAISPPLELQTRINSRR